MEKKKKNERENKKKENERA
ncbi:uncharacterized protein G2W53_031349 [Senna tora]|uniref:Uncharacterized protein n=1 Tax=Senna tora TaxID=362788 RepID=A0A834T944_9FABA|nr:uncharacterized protein G2W53_031349 [Senna tora]